MAVDLQFRPSSLGPGSQHGRAVCGRFCLAQRLGRVLRPKTDGSTAHFYTVITRDTVDAEFAAHRQRFLAEQGYAYRIVDADAG